MERKKALITGIFGQDGSFLYELLRQKDYQVYGVVRDHLSSNSKKIKEELAQKGENPILYEIDLQESEEIKKVIERIRPNEIYHLSASHVSSEGKRSGEAMDENTMFQRNVTATANLLSACYEVSRSTRVLTAGSCLMYDASETGRQDETTLYCSNSLYGIGKITENRLVEYYRKKGLYACTAILYNHESYRRSADFVTKKIVKNMCMLKKNAEHRFSLGNIEVKKDWGYAGDYVRGMYLMLQNREPADYILSSNELHSIKEFLETCAEILQLDNWEKNLSIDSNITNRSNAAQLYGNPQKAEKELGWRREKKFEEWILEMIMREQEQ